MARQMLQNLFLCEKWDIYQPLPSDGEVRLHNNCGAVLPAWWPVPGKPNEAMLLHRLSQDHPDQVGHYLDQMRGSEDIGQIAAQAYEVVDRENGGI
jgi:hypothetical protein